VIHPDMCRGLVPRIRTDYTSTFVIRVTDMSCVTVRAGYSYANSPAPNQSAKLIRLRRSYSASRMTQ
jgi:hypothetical protein